MSNNVLSVSGQHYLFDVQAFASTVLAIGGDEYSYTLRDRTTKLVIEDVSTGISELGVLVETTETAKDLEAAFEAAGVEFFELAESTPRIALPASHPLVNASSLVIEQLEDYPYVHFEQEPDTPASFAEEASIVTSPRKAIATTDRASLSELIVALNGYTVTSGILVGISDGKGLATVPLDTDVKLHLGYIARRGEALSEAGELFAGKLKAALEMYARP